MPAAPASPHLRCTSRTGSSSSGCPRNGSPRCRATARRISRCWSTRWSSSSGKSGRWVGRAVFRSPGCAGSCRGTCASAIAGSASAARRIGMPASEALALFPGGTADLVACFSRWADLRMLDRLETQTLDPLHLPERIALAVTTRLEIVGPCREAVRRALSLLSLPQHTPLGLGLLYQTVDDIWWAAGDRATDFSFYTKRMTLAGIYAATVFYWLEDSSEDFA